MGNEWKFGDILCHTGGPGALYPDRRIMYVGPCSYGGGHESVVGLLVGASMDDFDRPGHLCDLEHSGGYLIECLEKVDE